MHRFCLTLIAGLALAAAAHSQPLMLISNEMGNSISTLNVQTGVVGTFHTGLANPDGIMLGPDGFVYSTSFSGGTYNRITSPTTFQTIAAGMNGSAGFQRDAAGNIFVANFGSPGGGGVNVSRIAPDGTIAVSFATGLATPDDVKFNNARTILYVSEWANHSIRRIDPATGVVTPFINAAAGLARPSAMVVDSADNIYVTNWDTASVSRITPAGVVTNNFATGIPNSFGLLLDEAGGFFYATAWNAGTVSRFPLLGGAATVIASGFTGPTFMAFLPVPEPTWTLLAAAIGAGCWLARGRISPKSVSSGERR